MSSIPMMKHLHEIRYRISYTLYGLFATCITSYIYKEEVFYIFSKPLGQKFIYTNLIEAFTAYIYLSIVMSIFMIYPLFIYQIWSFIVPGLYIYEKKIVRFFLQFSILLFVGAVYTGYFVLLPTAYAFLASFQKLGEEQVFTIELQAKVYDYLVLNTKLLLALGLCFQLPIIILIIWKYNSDIYIWIVRKRKFIYLLCIVIATLITPPDIFSQLIVAVPLLLFFEVSILSIKLICEYSKYMGMEAIGVEPTA